VIATRTRAAIVATAAAATALLVGVGSALAADGGQVWTSAGCGSCHTLNVTGSRARIGPNLDELAPTALQVGTQVRSGGGSMPSFATALTSDQIDALAAFVAANAGRLPGMKAVAGTIVPTATGPLPPAAPWVFSLQVKLAKIGLFSGPQTGVFGPVTTAAVIAFQTRAGLPADGKWGPASQAALDKAATASKVGASAATAATATASTTSATSSTVLPAPAAWVQSLQTKLAKLGYFSGPVTGVLGPVTQAAVKTFQANAGLTADGKWGPASQGALEKALAAKTG